jgi:hypothetical protein
MKQMIKDEHLLPPIVKDLCESLVAPSTLENERANYFRRVEAIKLACEKALDKAGKRNSAFRRT